MLVFIVSNVVPLDLTFYQRKKFRHDLKKFFWDEPYVYRACTDEIIRRCVHVVEMLSVLEACHSSPMGGHHSGIHTSHKILQRGYY